MLLGSSIFALGAAQQLEVHVRTTKGIERELNLPVRFVPMTGQIRED